MTNYIVSYDLNGIHPSHAEMDKHIAALGCPTARILETVWYIKTSITIEALTAYISRILSTNDRLMVVEGARGVFHNTIPGDNPLIVTWNRRAVA